MIYYLGVMLSALANWLAGALAVFMVTAFAARFSDKILGWIGEVVGMVSNSASAAIGLPDVSGKFDNLPPEILSVMARLHLDVAMSIIVVAVGVRAVAGLFSGLRALRRGVTPS